jgi:YVTN family beta-propeller protein
MLTSQLRNLVAVFTIAGCSSSTPPPRKAYVGVFGDNKVAVVDVGTGSVLTTIAVPSPDGLVITPDGKKVFVSSNSGGVVDVIDTSTDTITGQMTVGAGPAGLSITRDGRHVLASVQTDGKATVIDTATNTVVASPDVAKAHNSAISADGTLGFVASQNTAAPAIDVVNLPAGTPGATLAIDKSPRALCEVGTKLYVTVAGSDAVEVVDATTGQLATSIATGGSPHDIRPTIDGASILTVSQTAGELEIIDPTTNAVTAHIATGTMPHWIALSSDGANAYVTNETDGTVVVVDLKTKAVTQTIAIGKQPRKIAIQP